MKIKLFRNLVRLLLLLVAIFTCQVQADNDFSVVVSIKPIHSIVTGLMKDVAEPVLLINDNRTPYDFSLTEEDRKSLSDAKLVVWVGKELESSLKPAINRLPDETQVMELLANPRLKILPSRHDINQRDPYFWMDSRNILILLDEIAEKLVEIDPTRAHVYTRNRREMLKPLLQVDKEYEYGYRGMKAGLSVQYYDLLQYFEQAYACKLKDLKFKGQPSI